MGFLSGTGIDRSSPIPYPDQTGFTDGIGRSPSGGLG